MPAGVTWSRYLKFTTAAMLSMFAGSQSVHLLYKPLDTFDFEYYPTFYLRDMNSCNIVDAFKISYLELKDMDKMVEKERTKLKVDKSKHNS